MQCIFLCIALPEKPGFTAFQDASLLYKRMYTKFPASVMNYSYTSKNIMNADISWLFSPLFVDKLYIIGIFRL